MTHNDRDQELLKQYMDHLLPEDDGNLEIIKQRLDKEAVRRRRKAALKRRSKRLYGLSVACILLMRGGGGRPPVADGNIPAGFPCGAFR